ncbi:MAG TPA: YceI family protein [Pyrinomonadaceae bacterium]|jgi:polyisoprenoid-binding protein YceI
MGEDENRRARYRLVADESRFTVQAFAEGLFSAFGHDPVIAIRDFTGEVEFTPGTLSDASVRMAIKTDSLAATDDVKEKDRAEIDHMMRADVLETAKYPEIVFTSTSVTAQRLGEGRYRARVIGDLTLHGVTQHNLWIQAEVTIKEEKLRAQGQFSLKQTDYQIKPVKVAGGTLKVKNELKFSFEIVAAKQESEFRTQNSGGQG